MKEKVTIQDIADALGVSRNTVSKAINNSEGLAVTTRDKILQKAVEMGYKQFSYVKAAASFYQAAGADLPLSPAFQGEIALFTTVFLTQSHFASLMLDKFQREISQLGYIVNTHRVSEENLRSKSLPYTFRLEQTKGIICIEMFNRDYDDMICELGLPVLFVDGPPRIGGFSLAADQLYMDNSTEISRFVCEALRRGDRRIGFIGNPDHCQSFHERFIAVQGTLLAEGVPLEAKYCIRYNHPDEIADVRILGFDDSSESRRSRPTMSTVHIHTQIMAYEAVHLLISRIKEPSLDFRTVHTQTDLIERESTKR